MSQLNGNGFAPGMYGQDFNTDVIAVIDPSTGEKYLVPANPPAAAIVPGGGSQPMGKRSIKLFASEIPAPEDFDSLLIPDGRMADVIWHEYYDSALITSAVLNQPVLFQAPAAPQPLNSNLQGANGTLQGNNRFLITSIRFEIENDVAADLLNLGLVQELYRTGTYQLMVQDKFYNQGKLMRFLNPLSVPLFNVVYMATNPFMSWRLPIQVPIGSKSGFNVPINFVAPVLVGNWRIFCYLGGALYRNVQ